MNKPCPKRSNVKCFLAHSFWTTWRSCQIWSPVKIQTRRSIKVHLKKSFLCHREYILVSVWDKHQCENDQNVIPKQQKLYLVEELTMVFSKPHVDSWNSLSSIQFRSLFSPSLGLLSGLKKNTSFHSTISNQRMFSILKCFVSILLCDAEQVNPKLPGAQLLAFLALRQRLWLNRADFWGTVSPINMTPAGLLLNGPVSWR